MTDKEFDGCLVLIPFMMKNKKSLSSKRNLKDFASGKYSKRKQRKDFKTI